MIPTNGNLVASIDFETSGRQPGYHEVIQVAVVPVSDDLRPLDYPPFYEEIRPRFPERAEAGASAVHKLDVWDLHENAPDADRVALWLHEYLDKLVPYFDRCFIPLAHNWPFESTFLDSWLGMEEKQTLFRADYRDAYQTATALNDRAFRNGYKPVFSRTNLGALCNHFGIVNAKPHDALHDAYAEIEVYRKLLQLEDSFSSYLDEKGSRITQMVDDSTTDTETRKRW